VKIDPLPPEAAFGGQDCPVPVLQLWNGSCSFDQTFALQRVPKFRRDLRL
jgi:hypothetical protein